MSEVFVEKKTNELIQLISVAEAGDGYIRFSNGLQVCYDLILDDTQTDGNYDKAVINFRKPFITSPVLTVSRYLSDITYTTNLDKEIHYGYLTEKSFVLRGINEADQANTINFSYIAIGKWK